MAALSSAFLLSSEGIEGIKIIYNKYEIFQNYLKYRIRIYNKALFIYLIVVLNGIIPATIIISTT